MKFIAILVPALLLSALSSSQENNPLINSGEVIQQGIKLHDEEKYKEAIAEYRKVTRGDTNYYFALYEIAYSQMNDSQFNAALQTCKLGLSVPNDKWPEFYTLYGNVVDDLGDSVRAVAIYDSAIRLYPATAELYLNKGTTLIKMKKYDEAIATLQQCLYINPYSSSAHYKLGVCALQTGRPVHAYISFINYLLLAPSGRYFSNCITGMSLISKAGDDIKELIEERTGEIGDNFTTMEKILLSKMALDKQYKPLLKIDDVITRQIQVLFEKLEYDENDPDFWMQYYVPFFKKVFAEKKFEPFVHRLFVNLKMDAIQDYIKKNKKELEDIVNETVEYYNQVRATREPSFTKRQNMRPVYHFEDGKLFGKGTLTEEDKLTGPWEFYYNSGNIRSKGNYNNDGKREGLWQYYFFDGSLKGKQLYKNGEQEGEEIFNHETGAVSTTATYKNGVEDGISTSHYLIGLPRASAEVKNGKLNGERRAYFSNGSLQVIEHYKEDSLHGVFKTYYKQGPIESEGNYVNGKLSGAYKAWHLNGKISMEGTYTDGEPSGVWKQYHPNGQLRFVKNFVAGLAEGDYTEYYDNGQVFYKCVFKKGKISGDVDYFDDDGKKYFTYSLDNDVAKTAVYFDKSGKEVGRSERKSKRLDLTTYYADGFKRSQAVYNDAGEITGQETYYFRSGKPSSVNNYEKGKLQGLSTGYHPSGKVQHTVNYTDDEKDGYEKFWYSHGQLEDEGWQVAGQMEGTWLSYDELGNKTFVTEYLNGDINGYKQEFYPNGKLMSETQYKLGWIQEYIQFDTTGKELSRSVIKNGKGRIVSLLENKKTYAEGTYVNGELEGSYRFYFFDGKVNTQQYYKKGQPDSIYRSYHYGGLPATEGQYKNGRRDGTWKVYFSSGKLNYVEKYEDGELNGKKVYYFENGKIDSEVEYKDGERNGITRKYDLDGSLVYQIRFENDRAAAYTYMDKTGKLLPEILIPGGMGTVKTYFANGKPSAEFAYENGKLMGPNIAYHSNGKLRTKGNEVYGLSEGTYMYYHPNGQVQFQYEMLHDNLHGYYKEFNEKGILTEEGTYYNGMPHNIIKIYDDNGKLKETRSYYYGKLLDVKK